MKLLQLNCWSGKLGTQLRRFLADKEFDVVCLQEDYLLRPRLGSVFTPSYALFPEDKYPYTAFGKTFGLRYMKELADFGNTILSIHPINHSEVVYTTKNKTPVEDLEVLDGDDYNVRNFVHAVIGTPKGALHVLTHHGFRDPDTKDGSDENTRQMQELADYIGSLKGPVVLTGDFNLHPKSKSLEPIHKKLKNLCVEFGVTSTRSELAKRKEVIDYIFVNDKVDVKNFEVSNMLVSDHKALILDFEIN